MSRQTVSYLQRRFAEVGLEPNARHGQNFLIDLNLLDFIVTLAEVSSRDVVLEVGTGTGSLTTQLAGRAAHVVTVEIDHHLHALAQQHLAAFSNVTMLNHDVLRNKNRIDERVMLGVGTALQQSGADQYKLVANLPYNVATSVIANLLLCDPCPTRMTVTVQKELAERMAAVPRTRDYSALSVWVQSICDVRIERVLAPTVFWPRPKVQSAVVSLEVSSERRAAIPDLAGWQRFVRSLFLHRRKLLRGVLVATYKQQLVKPQIDALLSELRLPDETRAEELTVPQLQELSEHVYALLPPRSTES